MNGSAHVVCVVSPLPNMIARDTNDIFFLLICWSSVRGESGRKETHQKWTVLGPTGLFQNLAKPL